MKQIFTFLVLLCGAVGMLSAQTKAPSKEAIQMAKDANNPLASITTLSLQNVYTPSMYGTEGSMNTAWIRAVQPIGGKVLIRASLPLNSVSMPGRDRSGLGDMNVFATWVLTGPTSHNQFGIGPILTMPTATSRWLGSGKWQAGVAVAGYFAKSNVMQMGVLATWQHSFAGGSDRRKVHVATIQPFVMWQVGGGTYLRSTAIKMLDFENSTYVLPLGAGIGKVVRVNKMIFNIFIEPQFTLWHEGKGVPKWQLFMGINSQF